MDRDQARRLWFHTLELHLPADDAATRSGLAGLWSAAGTGAIPADILEALALPDELDRRRAVVRRTRLHILAAGHDPDLLSTPAAGMRGL